MTSAELDAIIANLNSDRSDNEIKLTQFTKWLDTTLSTPYSMSGFHINCPIQRHTLIIYSTRLQTKHPCLHFASKEYIIYNKIPMPTCNPFSPRRELLDWGYSQMEIVTLRKDMLRQCSQGME